MRNISIRFSSYDWLTRIILILLFLFVFQEGFSQFYTNINDSIFILEEVYSIVDPLTGEFINDTIHLQEDYYSILNYKIPNITDTTQPYLTINGVSGSLEMTLAELKENLLKIDTVLYTFDTVKTVDPENGNLIESIIFEKAVDLPNLTDDLIPPKELNNTWVIESHGKRYNLLYRLDKACGPAIELKNVDPDMIYEIQVIVKNPDEVFLYRYSDNYGWMEIFNIMKHNSRCFIRYKSNYPSDIEEKSPI